MKFAFQPEVDTKHFVKAIQSSAGTFEKFLEKNLSNAYVEIRPVALQQPNDFLALPAFALGIMQNLSAAEVYIKKYQPQYAFCGHIHEGEGHKKVGKTDVYNLGVCGYKIIEIEQMLTDFMHAANRIEREEPAILQKTVLELDEMEQELNRILTNGNVLKALFQENKTYTQYVSQRHTHPIDSIMRSLNIIARQRRTINQLQHEREHAELEKARVETLLKRKQEIELSIYELRQIIDQIEKTNREILDLDAFAVVEPVPVVATNELQRLEFELQVIMGDPGIQSHFKRRTREMNQPESW